MKHFEFWNPRLFELPYYLYLGLGAARRLLRIKHLAKANYALDHGEIGIGSKVATQFAFDQTHFLPTQALPESLTDEEKAELIRAFGETHGYPVIAKSDIGSVGKGVVKIDAASDIASRVPQMQGPFLVQQFTELNVEYGVFYVRQGGTGIISGINRKHFPTVTGDGKSTVLQLAQRHERFTAHWQTFLQYADVERVPAVGEQLQLSFIGSHTMGCKFTDDTASVTQALKEAVCQVFENQPGFNFGRLDVKAQSDEAFLRGEFVIIEVNGVASLPTNMFDPKFSLWEGYRIFFRHARYLLDVAAEQRDQPMELDSYAGMIRRARRNAAMLNASHQELMGAKSGNTDSSG